MIRFVNNRKATATIVSPHAACCNLLLVPHLFSHDKPPKTHGQSSGPIRSLPMSRGGQVIPHVGLVDRCKVGNSPLIIDRFAVGVLPLPFQPLVQCPLMYHRISGGPSVASDVFHSRAWVAHECVTRKVAMAHRCSSAASRESSAKIGAPTSQQSTLPLRQRNGLILILQPGGPRARTQLTAAHSFLRETSRRHSRSAARGRRFGARSDSSHVCLSLASSATRNSANRDGFPASRGLRIMQAR
jgi:hypothetical protein